MARKRRQQEGGMTLSEAGHKGGMAVRDKYGPDFYSEIGKKGGNKVRELIERGKRAEER